VEKVLASALGHQAACMVTTLFTLKHKSLCSRTKMARSDGSILKIFDKIAKSSLVILDDLDLPEWEQQQRLI